MSTSGPALTSEHRELADAVHGQLTRLKSRALARITLAGGSRNREVWSAATERSRRLAGDGPEGVDLPCAAMPVGPWRRCARTPTHPSMPGRPRWRSTCRHPAQVKPVGELIGDALFNEAFFDDVFIPDEDVVADVNRGWLVAPATLGNERISIGGRAPTVWDPTAWSSFLTTLHPGSPHGRGDGSAR